MKHKSVVACVLVLLVIGICTAISYKNYIQSLNRVMVSSTAPNRIRIHSTAEGTLRFTDTQKFSLPEECKVEQILTDIGSYVSEGDPLVRLETDSLWEAYYRALMQQQAAEAQRGESAAGILAGRKAVKYAGQAADILKIIQNEGIVTAEISGQLIALNCEKDLPTSPQSYLEIGSLEGEGYFEWFLPPKDYRPFTDIQAQIANQKIDIEIKASVYEGNRNLYHFVSEPIPLQQMSAPAHGGYAKISATYVSEEYPAVLPLSSIQWDTDGAAYVFILAERGTVYGTEYYLQKTGITIEDRDDQRAAVISPLDNLVIHSMRPMQDLEAVFVLEE